MHLFSNFVFALPFPRVGPRSISVLLLSTIVGCGEDTGIRNTDDLLLPDDIVRSPEKVKISRSVPFLPSATDEYGRRGVARIINRSEESGEVSLVAIDDEGTSFGPLKLYIGGNTSKQFNSVDLENGSSALGLEGSTGRGKGSWRLEISGELDFEVLSYVEMLDGSYTPMDATVSWRDGALHVPIFDIGHETTHTSQLRLINLGDEHGTINVTGTDDRGTQRASWVSIEVPPQATRTYSASELETGAAQDFGGAFTGGTGTLRLALQSKQPFSVLSLSSSTNGHMTNLSSVAVNESTEDHSVPFLPSTSNPWMWEGLVRVINYSDVSGDVSINAIDDTGREYGPLILNIGAYETKHFTSRDLESGNDELNLIGKTGPGEGDWRLSLRSDFAIEVLAYVRMSDGLLTNVHDTVQREGTVHRVFTFHSSVLTHLMSRLRIVNPSTNDTLVAIYGIDDAGEMAAEPVLVRVYAGSTRTLTAFELESGIDGSAGLGNSNSSWQLLVESERPVTVLHLMHDSTGRIANVSHGSPHGRTFVADFAFGQQGFEADFADYPPADGSGYGLISDYKSLPDPFESVSALFLSGVNHSDDLFMFFRGQVGGFVPGASYDVLVTTEIVTDTPSGCFGIGGAPGESVWIKMGVTTIEPKPVLEGSWLRMNVDIGRQSNGASHVVVLGNVANHRDCEESSRWERKEFVDRLLPAPVSVPADGRVWLLLGVDSGFEGRTEVYFTRARVVFRRK